MSLDGSAVVRTVLRSGEGYVSGCLEECPSDGGPPPRQGFLATASGLRSQVWIAGGEDRGDVWRYDVAAGAWRAVAEVGGPVRALTYDGLFDRLLILVDRGELELLALSNGSEQTLGIWSGAGAMTAFGLAADGRGVVYVASTNGDEHCALRLSPSALFDGAPLEIDGVARGPGGIDQAGLVAGDAGLSALVLQDMYTLVGYPPASFDPPDESTVTECM